MQDKISSPYHGFPYKNEGYHAGENNLVFYKYILFNSQKCKRVARRGEWLDKEKTINGGNSN